MVFKQKPIDGISMGLTFDTRQNANAPFDGERPSMRADRNRGESSMMVGTPTPRRPEWAGVLNAPLPPIDPPNPPPGHKWGTLCQTYPEELCRPTISRQRCTARFKEMHELFVQAARRYRASSTTTRSHGRLRRVRCAGGQAGLHHTELTGH